MNRVMRLGLSFRSGNRDGPEAEMAYGKQGGLDLLLIYTRGGVGRSNRGASLVEPQVVSFR